MNQVYNGFDKELSLEDIIENTQTNGIDSTHKLSPLEEMARNPVQKGLSVTKEDIEKGSEKPLRAPMSNERETDLLKYEAEMDETIKKRAYVKVIKENLSEQEYIEMMDEISYLDISDPEHPFFNFKKDVITTDAEGNDVYVTVQDTDRKPKFVRIKTKEDEEEEIKKSQETKAESSEVESESDNSEAEEAHKKETIQVIIDKTGMGADIHFTEEERQKITESEEIRVKEIQTVNLSTLKIKKVTESFQEHVKHQEFSNSRTTICFPASGFYAHMNGLTYGELGDASLSIEGVTVSQYNKRLSIIYNKMTNISTGPFKNYEDFLKHFAFTDIYMALYGLFVATFPETSTIQLRCGNKDCNTTYNWQYPTRSILQLKDCNEVMLDKMHELTTASPAEYDAIRERAAVNNCKVIQLPKSKMIFEMGILSAYEFLYNFVPVLNDNTLMEEFGDELNPLLVGDFGLLSVIRKIYVPDDDGSYIEYDNYKDIMRAFFKIDPEENMIVRSIMSKLLESYQPHFAITDTVCPHCKAKTSEISVSMDDILFQTLQRLMSTTIDVSNIVSL